MFPRQSGKKEMSTIVENFKDAGPKLRERITEVFKAMKENGERGLAELLREDIPSLKPFVVEILKATGYVESRIRKLSHKDPSVRREAAAFLSGRNKICFSGYCSGSPRPGRRGQGRGNQSLGKTRDKR